MAAPEHNSDAQFNAFNVPVHVDGPDYVPADGAKPAMSRFRVSYYPHLMRVPATKPGGVWLHTSDAEFFLSTRQDIDRSSEHTRTFMYPSEEVAYPDGADGYPMRTMTIEIPVVITQCDLVVAERITSPGASLMAPQRIPLNVPATAPDGDGDGC